MAENEEPVTIRRFPDRARLLTQGDKQGVAAAGAKDGCLFRE